MSTTKNSRLRESIQRLSHQEGSPCIDCLVDGACRKSFVDGSACLEFAAYIQDIMEQEGMKIANKE